MQEHQTALYADQHGGAYYEETAAVLDNEQLQSAAAVRISACPREQNNAASHCRLAENNSTCVTVSWRLCLSMCRWADLVHLVMTGSSQRLATNMGHFSIASRSWSMSRMVQAMPSPAEADGSYAFFDGLHKSCSKCKQARASPGALMCISVVAICRVRPCCEPDQCQLRTEG